VYAQRAGETTVPAFTIRFDSTPMFGKPTEAQQVSTAPVSIVAKLPPGAEGLATIITTSQLTVRETWQPEPGDESAKPGDAFTRTITVEARDVPGMVLPALNLPAQEELRVYRKSPMVTDQTNRGELSGSRVETLTYICESAGTYELPGLSWAWWNPA